MRQLFVFRHGQTDWNKDRRFQGQNDVPLNPQGEDQMRRTGTLAANALRQMGLTADGVHFFWTSDLPRSRASAEIVKGRIHHELGWVIPCHEKTCLREFHMGALVGSTFDEIEARDPEGVRAWMLAQHTDRDEARYQGDPAESRRMVAERLLPLVETCNAWSQGGETGVGILSTHGGTLDVLLELFAARLVGSDRLVGNGDLLVLEPCHLFTHPFPTPGRFQHPEIEAPRPIVQGLNPCVGWRLARHWKVGDNIAARSVRAL